MSTVLATGATKKENVNELGLQNGSQNEVKGILISDKDKKAHYTLETWNYK